MRRSRIVLDGPVVITSAAPSLDEQHDARRRKYLTMMGIRVVCVIAAVVVASYSLWLALAFMVGGAVLPWCAVLIANDRPPQRSTAFVRYRPSTEAGISATATARDHEPVRNLSAPTSSAGPRTVYVLDAAATPPAGDINGKSDPT